MMQIIPPSMVPIAQGLIQSQGGNPNLFNYNGEINPTAVAELFFNQATVRTAITPDIVFPISSSGAPPSPAMQELLNQLRPSVVLSGPAGVVEIAPYGTAHGQTSWLPLALVGGGVVLFLGWAIFG
jgi:hypothetical protein